MSRTGTSSSAPAPADKRPLCRVPPEVEAELLASEEDIAAGRVVELTSEELAEWEATGELPAAVVQRLAALGCSESHD